jgi:hypothetical protein
MKNSYLVAEAGAASVDAGVTDVVVGAASVDGGVVTVVLGATSVEAGLLSVAEVSVLLLQAANVAAITNTKKSFFMFSVFLILFKQ